jgi:hypothetical protein
LHPSLIGEYYTLAAVPSTGDFVSYAAVTNFLSGKTPNVVHNSTGFGATFNALNTGSRFPAPYNVKDTSNFAVLWEGLFAAQTSGSYGFATASDDGSVLFIDGQMVVDNNAMQSYTPGDSNVVTYVELEAGMHQIAIAFFEAGGDQGLTVWFKPPESAAVQNSRTACSYRDGLGRARVGTLDGADGAVPSRTWRGHTARDGRRRHELQRRHSRPTAWTVVKEARNPDVRFRTSDTSACWTSRPAIWC